VSRKTRFQGVGLLEVIRNRIKGIEGLADK
jgi:hypothetical protein